MIENVIFPLAYTYNGHMPPAKPQDQKRESYLKIFFTKDEMAKLRALVDKRGISLAGFVRMITLEAIATDEAKTKRTSMGEGDIGAGE